MSSWACASCGGANPAGMRFCGHCGAPAAVEAEPAAETRRGHGCAPEFRRLNLVGVKGVAPASGARYVESDTQTQTSNFNFDGASEANVVKTRILNRLGEDGTPDDFRYHLSAHMTMNSNGVVTIDRTESRIDCN